MSPFAFLRELDGRAILLAALMIAYFAAPFIGAAVAARFAKSLPLANGMAVASIGGVLALFLGQAESAWFPVVVIGSALGAGAVGAVIGRAMRPSTVDI